MLGGIVGIRKPACAGEVICIMACQTLRFTSISNVQILHTYSSDTLSLPLEKYKQPTLEEPYWDMLHFMI